MYQQRQTSSVEGQYARLSLSADAPGSGLSGREVDHPNPWARARKQDNCFTDVRLLLHAVTHRTSVRLLMYQQRQTSSVEGQYARFSLPADAPGSGLFGRESNCPISLAYTRRRKTIALQTSGHCSTFPSGV